MARNNNSEAIEWDDGKKSVKVEARRGKLYVTLDAPGVYFEEERGHLDEVKGKDVLNCGHQRDDDGKKFNALIVVSDRREELEQLREDSEPEQTDDPLTYEVEEYSKGKGSWGQEITGKRLVPSKSYANMNARQRELHRRVDTENAPDDAEPGDVITLADLFDDARTTEDKEQEALKEAKETGENVVISRTSTECNDPSKECNTDRVARIATPSGEIEVERTHTY